MIYARAHDGRFFLTEDADGDAWLPDQPVVMVDWLCAGAYARWEAERSGLPWRLPGELEWEKAARGVDGRIFPWGDFADPTWACMVASHPGRLNMPVVDSFPVDSSPYGVRGMGGNVRDWCFDLYRKDGPPVEGGRVVMDFDPRPEIGGDRLNRGGSWGGIESLLRSAYRANVGHTYRSPLLGFRLARSVRGG